MGRPERPLDPGAGPVQALAWQLRRLRDENGRLSYRRLAQRAHYSASTLADAAKGDRLPSLEVALAYARALGGDEAEWRERWQAAASAVQGERAAEPEPPCPYRGLMAFEPEHGEWFFGRDHLIARLRELAGRAPMIGVFGASGSGKSSLLRAGLLGVPDGDPHRLTLLVTPGEHPLDALSGQAAKACGMDVHRLREELAENPAALDLAVRGRLADDTRALLVVDQFEEVFTLCGDEQERGRFTEALLDLAVGPGRRTTVVVGVRADFIGHLDPRLVAAVSEAQLLVGPPTAAELREIVLRPAAQAGLAVDPDLLATVLADTTAQPGSLPLLSHALQETWRHRAGERLTLAAYQRVGGVNGAIAQTAERVYAELGPEERRLTRRVFLRLTALGEGTEDTRRPIAQAELDGIGEPAAVAGLLERLAEARLVVIGEGSVEVAHEALIRAWPRLHRWLTDDRADLRVHRGLTDAAHRWRELRRDPGALYRGAQLARAAAWAEENSGELNQLESAFLQASRRLERRRARLLGRVAAVMGVLLVAVLAAGGLALQQGKEAGHQQRVATSHQVSLKARGLVGTDADLAGLLAVAAYRLNPDAETAGSVVSAAAAARRRVELNAGGAYVFEVAFQPGGRLLATAGGDGVVTIWDPARRVPVRTFTEHLEPGKLIYVRRVAYDADGGLLASVGRTQGPPPTPGKLVVREPGTGRVVFQVTRPEVSDAMAISPDGRLLAFGASRGRIEVWDLIEGTFRVFDGQEGVVGGLSFSHDGALLAATTGQERYPVVWDVATGRPHGTIPARFVHRIEFGPGRTLVTASDQLGVHFWDVTTGRTTELGSLPRQEPYAWDISAPVGDLIAMADENGMIMIWDHRRNELVTSYQDRTRAETLSLVLARDGRRLVSAGFGGEIVLRDPVVPPFTGHSAAVNAVEVSPDGTTVASAGSDNTVRLWTVDGRPLRRLDGHPDHVEAVAFSPDGARLAAVTRDHHVVLWDLDTGKKITTIRYQGLGASTDVAYDPRGRGLMAAALGWQQWDLDPSGRATPAPVPPPSLLATGLAYAPDGRMAAGISSYGILVGWDLAANLPRYRVSTGQGAILDVAFSPDGRLLATAGANRTVKLWDAATGKQLGDALSGHTGTVEALAFSRDGRRLAATGSDRTIIVWNLSDRTPVAVLTGHEAPVHALAFTAEGDLVSGGNDNRIIKWALDPSQAVTRICAAVGRGLSRAEWAAYLPATPYQAVCG